MRTRIYPLALAATVCLSIGLAPTRAAEMYDLDQSHFSIVFSVAHLNMSYTYGIFRQAQGRFVLDRENPTGCQFQMTINADSIDTNNADRDKHLKSPDFFNVAQFPTITFQSTACAQDTASQGVVYSVSGNLTMHGQTRQIAIPVQFLGEGPGPGNRDYHTGFMSQFTLKRSDFGMTNLPQFVGDAVGVTVSFEGVRVDGTAAQPAQ